MYKIRSRFREVNLDFGMWRGYLYLMPTINVYLAQPLYDRLLRRNREGFNLSRIVQSALSKALTDPPEKSAPELVGDLKRTVKQLSEILEA